MGRLEKKGMGVKKNGSPPKLAKSGSKRLLARIWPKEGIFPRFPNANFNS